jgi:hypothetical protein
LNGVLELQELLRLKNAQMEALTEELAKLYLFNLNISHSFVIKEIIMKIISRRNPTFFSFFG